MKKTVLIAGAVLALTSLAQAQKSAPKAYLRLGAGYNFTHAGMTGLSGTSSSGGGTATYNMKKTSFGTGGAVSLAAGYMLSRHIGLELGVDATIAPKEYKYTDTYSGIASTTTDENTYQAKLPVYVIPAVVLTTGGTGLQVYGRFGVALPAADKFESTSKSTTTGAGPISVKEEKYTYKNHFGIGFQGAMGILLPVSSSIALWGEAVGISRNAFLKSSEQTGYTVNGVDKLGTLTTHDKMTDFEFEYTTSGANNPSEPSKATPVAIAYSTVGLRIGLSLLF